MTSIYYWLNKQEVIALHDEAVKDFGGSLGVLNEGALESSIMRLQVAHSEPESNICDLAAAYGYGLVKNHCFVDGNKRIAFITVDVFLIRNGYELVAPEVEAVEVMVDVAKGKLSQAELATWLTSNIEEIAE